MLWQLCYNIAKALLFFSKEDPWKATCIRTVAVSGLEQSKDHALVIEGIERYLETAK